MISILYIVLNKEYRKLHTKIEKIFLVSLLIITYLFICEFTEISELN